MGRLLTKNTKRGMGFADNAIFISDPLVLETDNAKNSPKTRPTIHRRITTKICAFLCATERLNIKRVFICALPPFTFNRQLAGTEVVQQNGHKTPKIAVCLDTIHQNADDFKLNRINFLFL